MKKISPPSDRKIKSLSVKLEQTHKIHWDIQKKLDDMLQPFILDCIKRKDADSISKMTDKMPKHFFYSFYMYQAILEIKSKKKKK
jgi:hypothetical protein